MKKATINIDQALRTRAALTCTDFIGEGFTIFGKFIGGFVGYLVIYIILSIVISLLTTALLGPLGIAGLIINQLISYAISALFSPGFYFVSHQIKSGRPYEFGDLFYGYKSNPVGFIVLYFANALTGLILLAPLGIIAYFVIDIPGLASSFRPENFIYIFQAFGMMIFFFILLGLVIASLLCFSTCLYTITEANIIDSIFYSIRGGIKNIGHLILFWFLMALINTAAVIPLGLGLLFTIPATYCAIYAAFHSIFKPNDNEMADKINSFGQNTPDINMEADESRA